MVDHEAFEQANVRADERLTQGPTATFARYDKRVHRVVIGLSSGIEIPFCRAPPRGLSRPSRPTWISSKSAHRAWVCTSRSWTPISTCRRSWKDSSAANNGWPRNSASNDLLREYMLPASISLLLSFPRSFHMAHAHDTSYKLLFSAPELVHDLVLGFIPDEWLHSLDYSTLEKMPGS
jgi:hypothetical protein